MGKWLNNLGLLYQAQGRYAEAEPLLRRSLTIDEKVLGPDHIDTGRQLGNLGFLAYDQSDWTQAADYLRRGTGVIKRRTERGVAGDAEGSSTGEAQRLRAPFLGLVKVTYRHMAQSPKAALATEMFETAQWALASDAAASLAQLAARSARGSGELAGLVRERQDLVGEWQAKDKLLIAAKSNEPAKRSADAEKALANRLGAIDTRLAEINQRLARDFPGYAALASPAPVSVAEVQAQLAVDEALVVFLDMGERKPLPEETFVWVATKTDVRWVRSELGTAALTREVAALRCGLDDAAWDGAGKEQCAMALGRAVPDKTPDPLPFDHARASFTWACSARFRTSATGARLAREKQQCPDRPTLQIAARVEIRSGVGGVETRSGLASLAHLKMQTPLPETADELCAVAQDVKADARDIHLGTKATEREVKRLSASGELGQYRMVHFATHGTLAGELKGTHEPGMILTPPETASEEDDGYLSASDIAGLKLDADWVILSACNTAAGGAANAEALSGLGRAFIYAGARALLVSHWAVYSDATVKLITGAVAEMVRDAKAGRAEALRRSMLRLIDKGGPHEAHPAFWAPFVVVGEGGRGG